jgi:hypothetical protein
LKRIFKKIYGFVFYFFFSLFVLLGTWCLPPKMFERVLEEIKAKFNTEFILKKGKENKLKL